MRIQVRKHLNGKQYKTCKFTLEEQGFHIIGMVIEASTLYYRALLFCILVNNTSNKPPRKKIILSCTSIFKMFFLLITNVLECTSALYMDFTYINKSRFHYNSSCPNDNWIKANNSCWVCHDASHIPMKSRLNDMLGGDVPNTYAIVLLLLWPMFT
jgi:hypothetical protein